MIELFVRELKKNTGLAVVFAIVLFTVFSILSAYAVNTFAIDNRVQYKFSEVSKRQDLSDSRQAKNTLDIMRVGATASIAIVSGEKYGLQQILNLNSREIFDLERRESDGEAAPRDLKRLDALRIQTRDDINDLKNISNKLDGLKTLEKKLTIILTQEILTLAKS